MADQVGIVQQHEPAELVAVGDVGLLERVRAPRRDRVPAQRPIEPQRTEPRPRAAAAPAGADSVALRLRRRHASNSAGSLPIIRRDEALSVSRHNQGSVMAKIRTETDTFGPIEVPADRYWGAQTQRSLREFPHRRRAHAAAAHPRARPRQARRRRGEPVARAARPQARARDRRGRPGGDRRQARRSFPAGRVADRLRHADQHEPERGDREPRQRDARRQARREVAGASERSRQHEPVVERRVPDRAAYRGGERDRPPARSGARASARGARTQDQGVRPDREDRPHPHAGRDAAHARPGILRLCRAGEARASRACGSR